MADEQFDIAINLTVSNFQQGTQVVARLMDDMSDHFGTGSKRLDTLNGRLLEYGGAQRKTASAVEVASKQNALYNQYLYDQEKGLARNTQSLVTQRYALYDVASTYGIIGAALLAADGYAIKLAADFESAFTSVERTSDGSIDQIAGLRDALVDLSTQIPLTFQQLSEIAALGNQLGIDPAQIESFTETVAQFSAVTGISAEAAAQAFGRLQNILGITAEDYDNLASAIVYVARTSAATEPQIIALAQRLGATATRAGLTAAEVVGLSGALASLAVAPERAQGVLETYFNTLNTAVAEGGDSLTYFAIVAGKTEAQISSMVRSGQGLDLLTAILDRLPNSTVDQTTALQALGLEGLRASEVFGRLAGNGALLEQQIAGSVKAYEEAAEIQRQFALVADDLNTKIQTLVNSVNALIEAASGGNVAGLAGLLQILIDITNAVRGFVETPTGQYISTLVIALTAAVGVFFAYRAAVALATASTFALITAQQGLASAGFATGLRGLAQALGLISVSADTATASTLSLKNAFLALGKATLVIFALQQAIEFFSDPLNYGKEGIDGLSSATYNLASGLGATVAQARQLANWISVLAQNANIFGTISGFLNMANGTAAGQQTGRRSSGGSFGPAVTAQIEDTTAATEDYSAALGSVGGSAAGAAKQVRTLLDYASDLGQVVDRAFDIRFGSQSALDTVTTSWMDLNEQIDEYRRKVLELTADRAIQSYFLSVAEAYGDTLRAGELRSNIADIDAELADATANASTELNGNSKAAITNRKRITDLVAGYGDYIEALAAGGADQATLNAAVAQSRTDFLAQAQALGYSNAQLVPYIAHFNDMATAIARVPRNITVTANADPALQALNEFMAQARSIGGGGVSVPVNLDVAKAARAYGIQSQIDLLTARMAATRAIGTKEITAANIARLVAQLNSGNYAEGGYTGNGGKYEPKGVVHGGEFVMTKKAVSNAGVGRMYAMMRAFETGRGYAMGGYVPSPVAVGGGGGMMGLSPQDRGILRGILDGVQNFQPGYLPDEMISRASQRGDTKRKSMGELG